jgi:uncharacterized protein (DUF736 family)
MATIGSFKKVNAEFQTEIVTLTVQAGGVSIVPEANRGSDAAPSHLRWPRRNWRRLAEALCRRPRLSLGQARRPSFNAPIFANLFDGEDDTYNLIWSRGRRQNGD